MTEPQLSGWTRRSSRPLSALPRLRTLIAIAGILCVAGVSASWAQGRKPAKSQYELDLEKQQAEESSSAPSDRSVSVPADLPGMKTPAAPAPVSLPPAEDMISRDAEASVPPVSGSDAEARPQAPMPASTVVEEAPPAAPEGSRIHTVWVWQESRDCLWKLAKDYYGDPWKWKQIYLANRNTILDPGVIFPKQRIVIPRLNP
jgi:nucleoid-associated protein YgaU